MSFAFEGVDLKVGIEVSGPLSRRRAFPLPLAVAVDDVACSFAEVVRVWVEDMTAGVVGRSRALVDACCDRCRNSV
jgi:hypothetical protein